MVDANGDGQVTRADLRKPSSLSNGLYDIMKNLTTLWGPAAITLYAGLATIFEWPDTEKYITAAGLVLVFLGTVLKVNSTRYANENSAGTLILNEDDPDAATVGLSLSLPYEAIKGKKVITLDVDKSNL